MSETDKAPRTNRWPSPPTPPDPLSRLWERGEGHLETCRWIPHSGHANPRHLRTRPKPSSSFHVHCKKNEEDRIMSAQSNRMTLAFSGAAILAILCGGKAFCQSATPASPATNALPPVVHYHFHQHNYPGSLPGSSPYWAATASQVPNAFSPVPYAASPLNTQDPSGESAYGPAAYNQNPYTFIPMNALGGQGLPYSGSPGGWRPTAAWPYPAGYVPGPYALCRLRTQIPTWRSPRGSSTCSCRRRMRSCS